MIFPERVPGLRWLTILMGVYGIVWMSLEGKLTRVLLMGIVVILTVIGYLMQRVFGGRLFNFAGWLVVTGGGGGVIGLGLGPLTFVFMALKTGLHGHGPEFRPSEIEWVLSMIPLWGLAGLVAGLGIGIIFWGFRRNR